MLPLLVFSFFFIRSSRVPYAYVSIKSIDCILLSSFQLKAVLLINSVKTLCVSLLNLCCYFNLIFSTNSFSKALRLSTLIFTVFSKKFFIKKSFWCPVRQSTLILIFFSKHFILLSSQTAFKQSLWSWNLSFQFLRNFFATFGFSFSLFVSFK